MKTLVHPWPVHGKGTRIVPVFLPFAGCRTRCIYCAQTLQTGRSLQGVRQVLDEAFSMLRARSKRGLEPCELAFYGGTFTALESSAFGFCLHSALEWRNMGLISSWRCSTRPDCLDERLLLDMRAAGCTTVELGIQSFVNEVLRTSLRGYDAETALKAMEMVKNAGLKLGVQLLPGLPGHTASDFVDDVNIELSPLACAYARARGADRMSSYGDFVALSDTCDAATATLIKREVSDGVIAPGYTPEALEILKGKRKGTYNVISIDPQYVPEPIERKQVFGITFEQGSN